LPLSHGGTAAGATDLLVGATVVTALACWAVEAARRSASPVGCPIGTVRSRIFRAREAIDEKLRPLLSDREDQT
jgi:hypothetical protein